MNGTGVRWKTLYTQKNLTTTGISKILNYSGSRIYLLLSGFSSVITLYKLGLSVWGIFFLYEVSTYKDSSVQGTWTFALGHGLSGIASSCQYGNTCSTHTYTEQGGKGEAASLVLSWILAVLSSRLYDYFLPSCPSSCPPLGTSEL